MTPFRCIPIPTETADRFRLTGRDDRDNPVRRLVAGSGAAFPCRHCLCPAEPGEAVLLGSYDLPRPRGLYWTPSPIFLHEAACRRAEVVNEVAPIVRANALVSIRAYDAMDQCIYDLGHVCPGHDVDDPLARALDDHRTAFVNIHTARPGCWLSLIERLSEPAGPASSDIGGV